MYDTYFNRYTQFPAFRLHELMVFQGLLFSPLYKEYYVQLSSVHLQTTNYYKKKSH